MPEFDVFLSLNSSDRPAVRELDAALVKRGLAVWLDTTGGTRSWQTRKPR